MYVGKFANGAAFAAFAAAVGAFATPDEVVLGHTDTPHDQIEKATPNFYDENGDPLSVHTSMDEALQAGEDSARAAAAASGTKNEYGVATIKGHVNADGKQTYYNSAAFTSNHPDAIRLSVKGLQSSLVGINHLHPAGYGSRPSSGDRNQYKALVKGGFSEFRGIYSFGDTGNYRHGPRSPGFFGKRTFSCGGASASTWSCPAIGNDWKR